MLKIDANRTHYLKWKLDIGDGHYSIRYHFLWQNKKEMEKKYILKHHAHSTFSEISEPMARMMINKHSIAEEEIVASAQLTNDKSNVSGIHKKTVIDDNTIKSMLGDTEDQLLNKMKHKFYKKQG